MNVELCATYAISTKWVCHKLFTNTQSIFSSLAYFCLSRQCRTICLQVFLPRHTVHVLKRPDPDCCIIFKKFVLSTKKKNTLYIHTTLQFSMAACVFMLRIVEQYYVPLLAIVYCRAVLCLQSFSFALD